MSQLSLTTAQQLMSILLRVLTTGLEKGETSPLARLVDLVAVGRVEHGDGEQVLDQVELKLKQAMRQRAAEEHWNIFSSPW